MPPPKSAFLQQLDWEMLDKSKWEALNLQTGWRLRPMVAETAVLTKNSNQAHLTLTKLNEMKTLSKSILTLSRSCPGPGATLNRALEKMFLLKDAMLALLSLLRETTRSSLWMDNCLRFLLTRNPQRQKTPASSVRGEPLATLKTTQMPLQDLWDGVHHLWVQTLQKRSLWDQFYSSSRPPRTSRYLQSMTS